MGTEGIPTYSHRWNATNWSSEEACRASTQNKHCNIHCFHVKGQVVLSIAIIFENYKGIICHSLINMQLLCILLLSSLRVMNDKVPSFSACLCVWWDRKGLGLLCAVEMLQVKLWDWMTSRYMMSSLRMLIGHFINIIRIRNETSSGTRISIWSVFGMFKLNRVVAVIHVYLVYIQDT